MPDRATVRVPATSANLGPGFDCLGLALALTIDVTISPEPLDNVAPQPMVVAAAKAAYRAAGRPEPGELFVAWDGSISTGAAGDFPVGRGLGASAALRVAGLVGANALMDGPLALDDLLALGADLEGHADNVAPALFGGLQVAVRDGPPGAGWHRLAVPLPAGLRVVLFVPDFSMPTQESRRRLPQKLPREDAVFNVGRAALLVGALTQGRWELLDAATQDRLHQPARAQIFPALYDIFDAARNAGAHAAYLSGAGSAVAALATEHEERIARLMQQAAIARGYSGRTIITAPSAAGAQLLDRG